MIWETEVKDDSRILLWYLEGQWCWGLRYRAVGEGPMLGERC